MPLPVDAERPNSTGNTYEKGLLGQPEPQSTPVFMPTPFNAERTPGKGACFFWSATSRHKGRSHIAPQFCGFRSIYAYTLSRSHRS